MKTPSAAASAALAVVSMTLWVGTGAVNNREATTAKKAFRYTGEDQKWVSRWISLSLSLSLSPPPPNLH
jgi:hypothetical protein